MSSDPINPAHYKHLPAEAIDIIMAAIAKAPSNESAYLHGQVLKYLLRCWEKNGVEDLRKGKVYFDRLVALFDEVLAEASGASETPSNEPKEQAQQPEDFIAEFFDAVSKTLGPTPPKPSPTQPPSGYRLLGPAKDHARFAGDLYWSISGGDWTPLLLHQVSYANQHDWVACRKHEEPPPKHRDPTQADLRDGPIECEVRDCDIQAWKKATLQSIYPGAAYEFQVQKHGCLRENRYAQCRIEVAE